MENVKKIIKSNIILLLDNEKWVQEVLKHGIIKFYNYRMIWQGGLPCGYNETYCVRDFTSTFSESATIHISVSRG